MDLKNWVGGYGLYSCNLEYRLVSGCCESCNEHFGSTKAWEFVDQLRYSLLLSPCVARMMPAAPVNRPVNSSEELARTLRPTRSCRSRITQQDGRIVAELTVNRTKGL